MVLASPWRSTVIVSIAHAEVTAATQANLYGAWSNLVTGDRPQGLDHCFLLESDGVVQVLAVWQSQDAHDRAIEDEGAHPAFAVFDAEGIDPNQTVFNVVGHLDS
ncbi:MAG: hypothetical protein ACR2N7_01015 [Acidimicrobiia bacterium]